MKLYNFHFYYKNFHCKCNIILLFLFLFILFNNSLFIRFFNKKPKISIFLPIYNKEDTLLQSIKSIQSQTLKDIEIIAVNDCSNDTSLNILKELSKTDHRIKIVNNDKNHGLLYSRAMGILNSSGEYLMNLDADDEFNDNKSLEFLYNKTKILKVDIIQFTALFKIDNSTFKCLYNNKILIQPNLYQSTFMPDNGINDYLIWNKLIKKEVFLRAYEDFKIAIYNGKWNYFEDDVWNILVNRYAKSKLCVDKIIYIYNNINNNSLMHNRFTKIEFQNLLYRHEMYKNIFQTKEEEKYLIFEYNFLFNRLKSNLDILLLINDKQIKTRIKNIFEYYISNYNCSNKQINDINKFLNSISVT